MISKADRVRIQNRAYRILEDHKITTLPVNPIEIAQKEDILVKPKNDCEPGVSAMLIRVGDNVGISYATYLNNHGFESFSIAHELGHYFLDGHMDHLFRTDEIHVSNAEYFGDNKIEQEANIFASALLMPETLFKDKLTLYEKGFTCIKEMSLLCNTSLTATAIRYAELTEDKVIIIVSTNGIIDYCCLSDSVFKLKDVEIPKKGHKIPPDTVTRLFSNNTGEISMMNKIGAETTFSDWLDCRSSKEAYEEAIGLGKYGKVLTVIS